MSRMATQMTVKDLIKVLTILHPEITVLVWDTEGGWAPVTGIVSDSSTVKLYSDTSVANDHGLSMVDLLISSIKETTGR